jgi:hypothetical protein
MRNKKKDTSPKEASHRAIMAAVTEEMKQPRMTKSARVEADAQSKNKHGELARHHSKGAAKTHIEQ